MLVIFILTIVSCFVFDYVNIKSTSIDLINSYKSLPSILSNKNISDDEKQKTLLKSSKFQFKKLTELIIKIIKINTINKIPTIPELNHISRK